MELPPPVLPSGWVRFFRGGARLTPTPPTREPLCPTATPHRYPLGGTFHKNFYPLGGHEKTLAPLGATPPHLPHSQPHPPKVLPYLSGTPPGEQPLSSPAQRMSHLPHRHGPPSGQRNPHHTLTLPHLHSATHSVTVTHSSFTHIYATIHYRTFTPPTAPSTTPHVVSTVPKEHKASSCLTVTYLKQ